MLAYQLYDSMAALTRFNLAAVEPIARLGRRGSSIEPTPAGRYAAFHETMTGLRLTHHRPPFAIEGAEERVVASTPFADLIHFETDRTDIRPTVLVVAPLSGHFATLVRATVEDLLIDHDVYITDWRNARDVALTDGPFGLDAFADHIIDFLGELGERNHVVAVCQSCVPALVATAVMAAGDDPATPTSLTLMAGPVDTRINPTEVNEFATSRPLDWFEHSVITRVSLQHRGAWRRVYPGFLQVGAFMSMNPQRHLESHIDVYRALVEDDRPTAQRIQDFYAEYFAVLDMAAEFYLETVDRVFQRHHLPQGQMQHHGRTIDLTAIDTTALLTIEGERDDICSIGQTMAAHDLCTRIPPARRAHHLQPGVGHYGVFSGSRWSQQIYPVVSSFIRANATATPSKRRRRPATARRA